MVRRRLLRAFFALLYTRLAWGYDGVAWLVSAGQWYRWAGVALPFIEAGPVLEVGCGRGRLLRPIANRGFAVVGVDRSEEMARHAARVSAQPVLRADALALPFPDGYFATLITTFPAPYVLEAATQREFARVVRPGGLWLWVDAPALDLGTRTALAQAVTWLAQGSAPPDPPRHLEEDRSGGQWAVTLRRLPVGQTSIGLRVARRMEQPKESSHAPLH